MNALIRGIRLIYFVVPLLLCAGGIFYFSSLKSVNIPEIGFNIEDKILHFFAYLLFGLLLIRALHRGKPQPILAKLMFVSIVLGFLYGLSDEIHQYYIPGRSSEFWDWFADALGVIAGTAIYRRFHEFDRQIIQYVFKKIA